MSKLFRWVDHFYPKPQRVREIALRSEYYVPEGLYGYRSLKGALPQGTIERIKDAFGFTKVRLINLRHRSTHFYHGLVHGKQRTQFFAHTDGPPSATRPMFSMVVYLSLKAPKDSGTGLFRHRKTGIWQRLPSADVSRPDRSQTELAEMLERDERRRSCWELLDSSENVYNRAVIFPAHWYHSSRRDFGSRLETGRIYQAFFFYGYPNVFEPCPAR